MKEPVFQTIEKMQFGWTKQGTIGNMQRPHYHDGYELYVQLEGRRNIFFNNQNYVLTPGSIFIIKPFVLHMTTNYEENEVYSRYLLNFSKRIFQDFLSPKESSDFLDEISTCITHLEQKQLQTVCDSFCKISEYWRRYRSEHVARCEKLAYIEIYQMLDQLICFHVPTTGALRLNPVQAVPESEISRVLSYLETHYMEEITLDFAVKYAHMSRAHFYRIFRQTTGDTFLNYLNRFRIAKAHEYLVETGFSLQDIAKKTGFASTAHMTRVFKQIHGVSPSQYRKKTKSLFF